MKHIFQFILCFTLVNIFPKFTLGQTSGFIDNTFGTNGKILYNPFFGGQRMGKLITYSDTTFVWVGSTVFQNDGHGTLVGFLGDGQWNWDYGNSFVVTLDPSYDHEELNDAVLSPNEILTVVGKGYISGTPCALVAKYDPFGYPITSFGTNGYTVFPLDSTFGELTACDLNLDGSIIAGGNTHQVNDIDIRSTIVKLNVDGTLNASFGNMGKIVLNLPSPCHTLKDLFVLPSGSIFASGKIGYNISDTTWVTKLRPNGQVDSSFAQNGVLLIDSLPRLGMMAYRNNTVYVSGGNYSEGVVFAFDTLGQPKPNFGNRKLFDIPNFGTTINDIIFQNDSMLILGGYATFSEDDFLICRMNSNGIIDSSFAVNGYRRADIYTVDDDYVLGLAMQPNGRILAGGLKNDGSWVGREIAILGLYSSTVVTGDSEPVQHSINLGPNPTDEFFNVLSKGESIASIEMFNMAGDEVGISWQKKTNFGGQINVSHLVSGIYCVKILLENGSAEFRKLVVR